MKIYTLTNRHTTNPMMINGQLHARVGHAGMLERDMANAVVVVTALQDCEPEAELYTPIVKNDSRIVAGPVATEADLSAVNILADFWTLNIIDIDCNWYQVNIAQF